MSLTILPAIIISSDRTDKLLKLFASLITTPSYLSSVINVFDPPPKTKIFSLFSIYSKQKIFVSKRNFFESFFSGVLFHGFYLGGVFYSISIGMPTAIAALIVTLQPVLTNALSDPILNEKVSAKQ